MDEKDGSYLLFRPPDPDPQIHTLAPDRPSLRSHMVRSGYGRLSLGGDRREASSGDNRD